MTQRMRVFALAGIAASALLPAPTVAHANALSVSEASFQMAWRTMTWTTDEGTSTTCPVTLSGSFHSRTLAKVLNSRIGHVTNATVESRSCTGGILTALAEALPWTIHYGGFNGRLPTITRVTTRLVGVALELEIAFVDCLFRSDTSAPLGVMLNVEGGRTITSAQPDDTLQIDLARPEFACPLVGDASVSNSASMTSTAGTSVTVTLI